MKAKGVEKLERAWVGKLVLCYVRDFSGKPRGPYAGIVKGLSTNQAAVEDEGGKVYEATGLLVAISTLGRNSDYGEWPVRFNDVRAKWVPRSTLLL